MMSKIPTDIEVSHVYKYPETDEFSIQLGCETTDIDPYYSEQNKYIKNLILSMFTSSIKIPVIWNDPFTRGCSGGGMMGERAESICTNILKIHKNLSQDAHSDNWIICTPGIGRFFEQCKGYTQGGEFDGMKFGTHGSDIIGECPKIKIYQTDILTDKILVGQGDWHYCKYEILDISNLYNEFDLPIS